MGLRAKLGYTAAGLTVLAALLTPFLLYGLIAKGFVGLGLHVDEMYSGGPKLRSVQKGDYSITIHRAVYPHLLQSENSFVQLDWSPVSALPGARIRCRRHRWRRAARRPRELRCTQRSQSTAPRQRGAAEPALPGHARCGEGQVLQTYCARGQCDPGAGSAGEALAGHVGSGADLTSEIKRIGARFGCPIPNSIYRLRTAIEGFLTAKLFISSTGFWIAKCCRENIVPLIAAPFYSALARLRCGGFA